MRQECDLFGITEWFEPGEYQRVEQCLERLQSLGCTRLRTHLSSAGYSAAGGRDWYDWLLPVLGNRTELLPCLHDAQPSQFDAENSAGRPDIIPFPDFIDLMLDRYGGCFDAVELWSRPNDLPGSDRRGDGDQPDRAAMIAAAQWARRRGHKVVLGGPCASVPEWLDLIGERGALHVIDAVGLHCFPRSGVPDDAGWYGFEELVASVREVVHNHNPAVEVWVTQAGYATQRSDWIAQARFFLEALGMPAERIYWSVLGDRTSDDRTGHHPDERGHHNAGLYDTKDRPKLLARILSDGGVDALRRVLDLERPAPAVVTTKPVLVTGGAGFIGCNLADRLCADGEHVLVLDSLARPGVEENLVWLKSRHGRRISVNFSDIRDRDSLVRAVADASAVFHLAAQVAVTSSIADPIDDFETNARGTVDLLDGLRRMQSPPPIVFASTNKVYGNLTDVRLISDGDAYVPENPIFREFGIDEDRPIAFSTPYGCSKGCADQYVTDYAVNFGLAATVFRMSCIYGPRQFGNEDQGWIAHFVRQAIAGEPITIFGDGRQVRDILFVDDAIAAYLAAWRTSSPSCARVFNLGGGPGNAVSLRCVLRHVAALLGRDLEVEFAQWRPCDQKYYVSDTRRVRAALGLAAPVGWREGIARLVEWLSTSTTGQTSVPLRRASVPTEVSL